MTTSVTPPSVKVIGANGQISLGKQFAGRQVLVEEQGPGVWLVRTATVIPDNERWLHEPHAAADLVRVGRLATAGDDGMRGHGAAGDKEGFDDGTQMCRFDTSTHLRMAQNAVITDIRPGQKVLGGAHGLARKSFGLAQPGNFPLVLDGAPGKQRAFGCLHGEAPCTQLISEMQRE